MPKTSIILKELNRGSSLNFFSMNISNVLSINDLVIKKDSREVFVKGKKIELRRKEYDLLEFLASNQERVLNRLAILEYVWNYQTPINTNTLEVHINSLRKKIEKHDGKKLIYTVHGMGYKLSLFSQDHDYRQMVIPFFEVVEQKI